MQKLKSTFFPIDTALIKEKKKTDRRKTLKSEEKEKRRIQGKSNNNNTTLWFKIIFCLYHFVYILLMYFGYTVKSYLEFLCVSEILKHSNDTANLNINKYTNYDIIEIYIKRSSTTTQFFIAMDYLIMMSEKYLYSRKRKKHLARTFFTHPIEVTGFIHFENIFQFICLPKICTKI